MKKSFVYKKIDLTDELPFIKHLDDHAQAYIESCIVDVIYESFIITGDQDYATARLTTTSTEVTKLDFLTVNIGNPHNRHALSWLDKKMRLPGAAIEKLQTP